MLDELRSLAIFAKVIETGSFRAAASVLQLSPSVVSYHIAQLEERLNVALIYRSTRRLSLTPVGTQLFTNAKAMLSAAETGINQIADQASMPSGQLNITIPSILVRNQLLKNIAAFVNDFPNIMLSIRVSDVPQDIIREGIDLAIRIGDLKDSSLKAKKIFNLKRTLVASPLYSGNLKKPRSPEDLIAWNWLGFDMRPNTRKFIHRSGKMATIKFEPRIRADNVEAVCQLAIAGLGLATPPFFLVEEEIQKGQLIEILPTWQVESLPVFAVWPPNAPKNSLTFRLINYLSR